ncbi:ATP-binding protein [Phaeobacter inhibens]|uniref:ATP-binding protein n=1 Tax=Phaeobacter inhibens TaxID=221822 RepID=UPI0021A3C318|nr:ATP-binding protein [Phaeobacter inhibens]UWS06740.1 ATP-binding protein [Phaeobacter inhibens]
MKKISPRFSKWLLHRWKSSQRRKRTGPDNTRLLRRKKTVVYLWDGGEPTKAISIREPMAPPAHLCLESNFSETIAFIAKWRNSLSAGHKKSSALSKRHPWIVPPKKVGGMPRILGFTDFAKIEQLSTAVAMIVTAEYDRLAILADEVPPAVNIHEWSDAAFQKLFELGFFETVGLTKEVSSLQKNNGELRSMKIVSGSNATELEAATREIAKLSDFLAPSNGFSEEVSLALNSSLGEAMANVAAHAYPEGHEYIRKPVGKWWVTATADRSKGKLTVVIYDQGASIPVTYPQKDIPQAILDFITLRRVRTPRFDFENDGVYIEGAMKPGKTQTNQKDRGLGLPEMKELIDICGSGSLTIYSRGGVYRYDSQSEVKSFSHPHSVGGTLIEWVLDLDRQ